MKRRFVYEHIPVEHLSATDLRKEARGNVDAQAFRVTLTHENETAAERPQGLYFPQEGRMGIAWGSDATWADAESIEQGIEMYLNDGEAWNARN